MTALTKRELRLAYDQLGAIPATPTVCRLRDKIALIICERAGSHDPGAQVFRLELPLALAPTLNVYGSMKIWNRAKLYKAIDLQIMAQFTKWPKARSGTIPRRFVRVTRYSSAAVDELGADVLGGKVPIDRLVIAGVLRGDRAGDIERDAVWMKCPPKKGRVVVSVHELEDGG